MPTITSVSVVTRTNVGANKGGSGSAFAPVSIDFKRATTDRAAKGAAAGPVVDEEVASELQRAAYGCFRQSATPLPHEGDRAAHPSNEETLRRRPLATVNRGVGRDLLSVARDRPTQRNQDRTEGFAPRRQHVFVKAQAGEALRACRAQQIRQHRTKKLGLDRIDFRQRRIRASS